MENDSIQQGYEKIKQGIEGAGFIWDNEKDPDGIFEKTTSRSQVVVINNVQQVVKQHITLSLKYIGDGYIQSENGAREIKYGFSFYVDGNHEVDFWVKDVDELMSFFGR